MGLIEKRENHEFFNSAYEGTPPWDIGRSQKEIIRLAEDGEISGRVLDADVEQERTHCILPVWDLMCGV